MKLLLADDEYLVLEVLKKIIKWEELGLTLVGIATNGEDAYKQIVDKKPDIVISDIRMPLVDGLELVKKSNQLGLNCVFIIISGYKHFDYALSALKYGVKDYLLKPINASELNIVLQKIIHSHKEMNESRQTSNLDAATENIRGLFLPALLSHTLNLSNFAQINQQYHTHFVEEEYSCIIIHIDKFSGDGQDEFLEYQNNIFSEISAQTIQNLSPYCYEILKASKKQQIILLINYNTQNFSQIKKQLAFSLESAIKILGKYCRPIITFGLGSCTKFLHLEDAMQKAKCAIQDRIVKGVNHIIDVESSNRTELFILDSTIRKQLTTQIETLDLQSFADTVRKLFISCDSSKPATSLPYWTLCQSIYSLFWEIAGHIGDLEKNIQDFSEHKSIFLNCVTPTEMRQCLLEHTSERFSSYYDVSPGNGNSAISIVKKYITKYYMQKITLEDAGAMVYLNPVYFSILFKKETGVNFNYYLNEYRVEMSKRFLRQIQYSITDVALKVGFNSARYYAKQFKKYVGITPTEYRNINVSDVTPIT